MATTLQQVKVDAAVAYLRTGEWEYKIDIGDGNGVRSFKGKTQSEAFSLVSEAIKRFLRGESVTDINNTKSLSEWYATAREAGLGEMSS